MLSPSSTSFRLTRGVTRESAKRAIVPKHTVVASPPHLNFMSKETGSNEARWSFSPQDLLTRDFYAKEQPMIDGGCHNPREGAESSNLSNGPQPPKSITTLNIGSLDLAPSWQVTLLTYCEY